MKYLICLQYQSKPQYFQIDLLQLKGSYIGLGQARWKILAQNCHPKKVLTKSQNSQTEMFASEFLPQKWF